jgi:hypothetical protein
MPIFQVGYDGEGVGIGRIKMCTVPCSTKHGCEITSTYNLSLWWSYAAVVLYHAARGVLVF